MEHIQLTKIEASRRHLELAIFLFFAEADSVPLHTIVAAGYDVLRDINIRANGNVTLTKDSFIEIVASRDQDLAKRLRNTINSPQNFFKHADHDADAILYFNPELTIHLLFDACMVYSQLTKDLPVSMRIFDTWFKMQYRDLYRELPEVHTQLSELYLKYQGRPRQDFYDRMHYLCSQFNLCG